MTKITYIPGEIANAAVDEHGNRKPVTRTHHIFDDAKDKNQAEINAEVDDTFAFHQSEINALNSQNYVTVDSFSSLPTTGAVDTVYRVSNWDGTRQDPSVYSEYAWNGSQYVHLSTKTQIGEVFDISAYHATGGTLATYANLSAALDSNNGGGVPQSLQKGGMSIRFVQSSDNIYVQWRLTATSFTTDTTKWVAENEDFKNEVMQEVNEAIESITPIEITGDVTNAPDEEDLTSVNQGGTDVLKFKDKAYTPLTYSGMGRVYLRKNLVNGVNTLTQDMFYKGEVGSRVPNTNTIYIIQYDFTLGENITVPANCVLEFEGGSISAGSGENMDTITGTNTLINADYVKIFSTGITIAGTWIADNACPEWFGAKGDGVTDDRIALQKVVDSFSEIKLLEKNYLVSVNSNGYGIEIPSYRKIIGSSKVDWGQNHNTWIYSKPSDSYDAVVRLADRNISLEYVNIKGEDGEKNCDYIVEAVSDADQQGITWTSFLKLNHVNCWYAKKSCFHIHAFMSNFYNLIGQYSDENGMVFYSSETEGRGPGNIINNCYMLNCRKEAYKFGYVGNSTIITCAADHNGWNKNDDSDTDYYSVYSFTKCSTITLSGCGCEDCTTKVLDFNECECINIEGLKSYSSKLATGTAGASINNSLTIKISGAYFGKGYTIGDTIISATGSCYDISVENSVYADTNDYRYVITDENVSSDSTSPVCHIGVRNTQISDYLEETTFGNLAQSFHHVDLKIPISVKLTDNSYVLQNGTNKLRNIRGKLVISPKSTGAAATIIYADKDHSLIIENCDDIVFERMRFSAVYAEAQSPNHVVIVKNSKVLFKNCAIDKDRNVGITFLLMENSEVTLENCYYPDINNHALCEYDNTSNIIIKPAQTSGTTRPVLLLQKQVGFVFYDTTLDKPIFAKSVSNNGNTVWVDATGTPV